MPEDRLLHYRIVQKIGEGGMGVVYQAIDTRLDRPVALKVLRSIEDPKRKRQFVWEARAAAGLRHPNIVVVHDLESDASFDFIVMEYIPGHPLSDRLARGPIPIAETLRYAVQIASALEAAHTAGIVHRDLKPSNVLVTPEGSIKLVDFGLARLLDERGSGAAAGTCGYMSPEQAQGDPASPQSDIFSFGAVLYEMVTGRRAFAGKSAAVVLAAVLRDDPPSADSVAPDVPAAVSKVIAQCLRKDPRRRYQHIGDVRVALEDAASSRRVPAWRCGNLWRRVLLYSALACGPVFGGWLLYSRHDAPKTSSMPIPLTSYPGSERTAAWSPDGRQIVFTWDRDGNDRGDLYVIQPGSSQVLRLTSDPGVHSGAAWSPDGRSIAYMHVSEDWRHYSVEVMNSLGGAPRTLLRSDSLIGSPSWTPDGRAILFSMKSAGKGPIEIRAVFLATGEQRQITFPPAGVVGDLKPAISPDAKTLAFCRKTAWATAELYLLKMRPDLTAEGAPRRVTDLGYVAGPAWTPDGARILFEAHHEGTGVWQTDADGKHARPVFGVPDGASEPAVARRPDGRMSLVFTESDALNSIWRYSTTRGPGGIPVELAPSSRSQAYPRFSNDGKKLAFSSTRSGYPEIWVANADGSSPMQLTDLRHQLTETGHWSPDGGAIAFVSQDRGQRQIYVIGTSGGPALAITNEYGVDLGSGWSRDGNGYYYDSLRSGRREVWKAPRAGGASLQMTVDGGQGGFESNRGIFYYWTRVAGRGAVLMRRTGSVDEEVPLEPRGIPVTVTTAEGFYYRVTATGDVYLFDETTGRSTRVLAHPSKPFNQFTISPDGRWFAADFRRNDTVDLMIMETFR